MYLVDQYQFESGNRTLTYAAISDNIIVEVVFGHYHCWEYMNKLRVLTPDGTNIKVIATKEWEQSTRVDFNEIHSLVSVSIEEYVYNSPAAKGISKRTIKERQIRLLKICSLKLSLTLILLEDKCFWHTVIIINIALTFSNLSNVK